MGFAMLWIMIFHANLNVPFLKVLWEGGYGGVDIFMLLSAYGLYHSMKKHPVGLGAFYKKRLLRILPSYYAVLLILFFG